jgi:hypothetical protein
MPTPRSRRPCTRRAMRLRHRDPSRAGNSQACSGCLGLAGGEIDDRERHALAPTETRGRSPSIPADTISCAITPVSRLISTALTWAGAPTRATVSAAEADVIAPSTPSRSCSCSAMLVSIVPSSDASCRATISRRCQLVRCIEADATVGVARADVRTSDSHGVARRAVSAVTATGSARVSSPFRQAVANIDRALRFGRSHSAA